MKARRLQFGYLKTMNSLDEKTFPLLVRTVSMKELMIIFPSTLIGMMLFLKGEVLYAVVPFILAIYVLMYNEKSVPFYYQAIAFVEDLLQSTQKKKGGGKTKKGKKGKKVQLDLKRLNKGLEDLVVMLGSVLSLGVSLVVLNAEVYSGRPNIIAVVIAAVFAGLSLAYLLSKAVRSVSLASLRRRYSSS